MLQSRDGYRGRFPGLVPGKRVCGPLRLPDVKPPCSNLAGTSVPANFFCTPATKPRSDFSVVREVLGGAEPGHIAGTLRACRVFTSVIRDQPKGRNDDEIDLDPRDSGVGA